FSPDGRLLAAGDESRAVRLWDTETGKGVGRVLPHRRRPMAGCFSPDGRRLVVGLDNFQAQVWDTASGKALGMSVPLGLPVQMAITPDGRTARVANLTTAWSFPLPEPLKADAERIRLWVQVSGSIELDDGGGVRLLEKAEWVKRRQRLEALGGPLQ